MAEASSQPETPPSASAAVAARGDASRQSITSGSLFAETPISVHGVTPAAFRAKFNRDIRRGIVLMVCIYGALLAVTAIRQAIQGHNPGYLWVTVWLVVGAAFVTALLWAVALALGYFYGDRTALATTYELWPDGLVMRVIGRPPLRIDRGNVIGIGRDSRNNLHVRSATTQIVIPAEVNDLYALEATLLRWDPRSVKQRLRQSGDGAWASDLVVPISILIALQMPSHALLATALCTVGILWCGALAYRDYYHKMHFDPWRHRLAIAVPSALALLLAFRIWSAWTR